MRIGWILGWAIPESWFRPIAAGAFPGAAHAFFPAGPEAVDRLEAGRFDLNVAYSLGSLLLLEEAARFRESSVALLAPIFAFPQEEGLGGRIPRAKIQYLARWLGREPVAALADFYQRAGLNVPPSHPPGTLETLSWGLERLERNRAAPPMPRGWRAWCGASDPLLDAARLQAIDPAVRLVPEGTHHPEGLVRALAEEGE